MSLRRNSTMHLGMEEIPSRQPVGKVAAPFMGAFGRRPKPAATSSACQRFLRRGRIRSQGSALVPSIVDSFADEGISAPVNPARRNRFSKRAGSCEDDRTPVCTDHKLSSASLARLAN